MHKKRRRILPFVPTEDGARRLKQMASLATALTSSETEFSNELTYMPGMAPRSSNQARLEEGGMQVLNQEDKETIELCRAMQQRGQCPPLLVVFDKREGYLCVCATHSGGTHRFLWHTHREVPVVRTHTEADGDIKDMTFIAEYVGDVDYLEHRANDDCDCLMTLLLTEDPSQRLVICPDRRGNISRFIGGINNHIPDGKKKQNVKCVRYDIDGESHVLLVACRDIASESGHNRVCWQYFQFCHQNPIINVVPVCTDSKFDPIFRREPKCRKFIGAGYSGRQDFTSLL
ncbi:hypothetical protein ACP4OV_019990 [Aristida adscensionis]